MIPNGMDIVQVNNPSSEGKDLLMKVGNNDQI